MYQVSYYDAYFDKYERGLQYDTYAAAYAAVYHDFMRTTDTDITAAYINWRDDGIIYERGFIIDTDRDEWVDMDTREPVPAVVLAQQEEQER